MHTRLMKSFSTIFKTFFFIHLVTFLFICQIYIFFFRSFLIRMWSKTLKKMSCLSSKQLIWSTWSLKWVFKPKWVLQLFHTATQGSSKLLVVFKNTVWVVLRNKNVFFFAIYIFLITGGVWVLFKKMSMYFFTYRTIPNRKTLKNAFYGKNMKKCGFLGKICFWKMRKC